MGLLSRLKDEQSGIESAATEGAPFFCIATPTAGSVINQCGCDYVYRRVTVNLRIKNAAGLYSKLERAVGARWN